MKWKILIVILMVVTLSKLVLGGVTGCDPDVASCTTTCTPIFKTWNGDGWAFSTDECQDDDFGMDYWYIKNDSDSNCDTYVTGTGTDDCAEVNGMSWMGFIVCPSYERNSNAAVAYNDCWCWVEETNELCPVGLQGTVEAAFNLTHPFFATGTGGGGGGSSPANITAFMIIKPHITRVPYIILNQSLDFTIQ